MHQTGPDRWRPRPTQRWHGPPWRSPAAPAAWRFPPGAGQSLQTPGSWGMERGFGWRRGSDRRWRGRRFWFGDHCCEWMVGLAREGDLKTGKCGASSGIWTEQRCRCARSATHSRRRPSSGKAGWCSCVLKKKHRAARLRMHLEARGFKAAVLRASVDASKREHWVADQRVACRLAVHSAKHKSPGRNFLSRLFWWVRCVLGLSRSILTKY